ncbi:hypothetical protein B9Q10_00340 [Candidatus Marsarchaeota G2 archaeon ECH_B_SAG-E12]|jgi:thymidylate synthase (FAD)|uniref:Thymidylate synthase ThyX n=3 Tax=Candidatus Marsarchaeota TaxID=1978152 RepID=A0A2R6BYB7_9ARCH|nr:MAG: hypothetical protein B9Q10_00340 [Candidatus Marsarchaeota G2 archaeon ECH_B_SAG-E12]
MSVFFKEPAIRVVAYTRVSDNSMFVPASLISYSKEMEIGPDLLCALCAAGTHTSDSIFEILRKKLEKFSFENENLTNDQLKERIKVYLKSYINKVFDNTLARGHIDIADMSSYLIVGENVPRLASLFLCSPHYLSHEQQSLRYTEPKSFCLPKTVSENDKLSEKTKKVLSHSYNLYKEMVENEIPKEDARSVLPLAVNSNITTIGGGREFTYLVACSKNNSISLPSVIKDIVSQIENELVKVAPEVFRNRGPNYDLRRYYPAPQIFSRKNEFVEQAIKKSNGEKVTLLSFNENNLELNKEKIAKRIIDNDLSFYTNLLHIRATFLVKMSLEAAHQAIRHRTWNHDFESIYNAAERFEYVVPPKIQTSKFLQKYHEMIGELYDLYNETKYEISQEEAVIFLSNAHYIYDVIELDGWNIIGNLPLRTCEKAQWEIRSIAKLIASKIEWGSRDINFAGNRTLAFYALPPCHTFNVCFEDNSKEMCPIYYHKFVKPSMKNN